LLWLLSDARNDATLEAALARLPRGSGFVFRHYHLSPEAREARWHSLRRLAHARGHLAIYAGPAHEARALGADGIYGAPASPVVVHGLLTLATAHDFAELACARRRGADAVLLSPVFPTRSHPGGPTLGPLRFRLLARNSRVPVIALGGMTAARARRLGWPRWAAIDGLA
jgi:thiamine-phosphate pyrophosphorylase